MNRSHAWAWGLITMAALAGCGDGQGAELTAESDEIIGGKVDARTAPAVGALVNVFPSRDGSIYERFCTATLISPTRVLTAKHCTMGVNGPFGFTTDAIASTNIVTGEGPTRVALADSFVEETEVPVTTYIGFGSDVAIVRLKEPLLGVTPLPVALVDQRDVGKSMTAIGYGRASGEIDRASKAERRSAKATIKALEGSIFAPLVGFEEYHRQYGGSRSDNEREYAAAMLLDEYEMSTSSATAQMCAGDSGGPLLRTRNRKLEVVGVASYVLQTPSNDCAFGTVYARFGPKAKALIDRELAAR